MYTKHILNSTIVANIKECSIQMQCINEVCFGDIRIVIRFFSFLFYHC